MTWRALGDRRSRSRPRGAPRRRPRRGGAASSRPESIVAIGLARFIPAILGALPWPGSNSTASVPMLAPGIIPEPPIRPARQVAEDVAVLHRHHAARRGPRAAAPAASRCCPPRGPRTRCPGTGPATSRATSRKRPSVRFITAALCTAVTRERLFSTAYVKAYSTMRRLAPSEIALIEMPEPSGDRPPGGLLDAGDQLRGLGRAGLDLDAGVEVLGHVADDHHVHVLVAAAHARGRSGRGARWRTGCSPCAWRC